MGDVWACTALRRDNSNFTEGDDLVPFHKLTGWLTYSLLEPMEKVLGWQFDGLEDLTGLPEYRNGTRSCLCIILTDYIFFVNKAVCWSILASLSYDLAESLLRSIRTMTRLYRDYLLHIQLS